MRNGLTTDLDSGITLSDNLVLKFAKATMGRPKSPK
jgi:hypothetical protein